MSLNSLNSNLMDFLSEYDCVILGEHPAGLWAALHLVDLDKRILVLPLDSVESVRSLPRQVALDFGWTEEDWSRGDDVLQILTPDRRFNVPSTLEELEKEYEFQFGTPPGRAGEVSNEIVRGLAYFARGSETGPVIGQEWLRWASLCLETVHFDKEPGYVVRRMLRQLSSRGVHVAGAGALKQVFLDRGNLVGVQLSGSSRMIATRAGFICSHVDHLKSFMTEPVDLASDPQGWKFSMRFSCNSSALPRGLGSRLLFVARGAPVLEIQQTRPGEFNLSTQLPLGDESFDRGYQRRLCERMLRVCQEIIPDLEYNLQLLTPELRDPDRAEKVDLPRMYPFAAGHEVPWDRLIYGASRGLGFSAPLGNVFVVNSEADPRHGLWGAFQAAVSSLESYTKKDPTLANRAPLRLSPQL